MRHFKNPRKNLGALEAANVATLIEACSDIALVLDDKGLIRDIAHGDQFNLAMTEDWIGRAWADTVTTESRSKIADLLRVDVAKRPSRWRQVNHPVEHAADLPVRYSSLRMEQTGLVLALGRELKATAELQQRLVEAQVVLEREYGKLKGAETRYRALFQISTEAVLIIDAVNMRVTDCNPMSTKMLGNGSAKIIGRQFIDLFDAASSDAALALVAAARTSPRADDIQVGLATGHKRMWLSASLFRQDATSHLLVKLRPVGDAGAQQGSSGQRDRVFDIVSLLPEGFVVTDAERRIMTANGAFLELAELASEEQVRGQPIDRWLGRTGVEVDVLIANLRDHGSVRDFIMLFRGEHGSNEDVAVSAVAVPRGEIPGFGFSIRKIVRNDVFNRDIGQPLHNSIERLTKLVGRMPLKDLVRETTDLIERMCIEAALELTDDNRASAAEMLGLSRQSLYVKLRRHGMGDLDGDNNA